MAGSEIAAGLPEPLWTWGALALGLVVGSFANVCIHRLPRGQSLVSPPSRCPSCGASIRPWHNVPLVGYAALGGRCASCRAPIPARYPLVEAANGAAWWALAVSFGPGARTLVLMAFATVFIVLALIDLEHHILPDRLTLPGTAAALSASLLSGPPTPLVSALSAAGGYLVFAAVAWTAERYYREPALGQGDWKLAALVGALFGWRGLLLTVLLGTLAGALVGIALMVVWRRSGRAHVPLGTFLCAGALAVMLWGEPILRWYGAFTDV